MSHTLKTLGLALLACLALATMAASAIAGFQPAPEFAPSIGEAAMALTLSLIATSLLATHAICTPRSGLTRTQRTQLSDDADDTFTATRRNVLSEIDRRRAHRGIRQPIMLPAGAH